MKNRLSLLLFFSVFAWCLAQEAVISPNIAAPESLRFSTITPSVQLLSIEEAIIPEKPYEINVGSLFAPGQIITINVQVNTTDISELSLVCFSQKVPIKEFARGEWLAHYQLPGFVEPGRYFFELSLAGENGLGQTKEQLVFNVDYPLGAIVITGNRSVSSSVVLESLTVKTGEFYSEIKSEVNRQRILNIGYFQEAGFKKEVSGNQTFLIFTVTENPTIKEIRVIGSVEFSSDELKEKFSLKEGDVLSFRTLQKDMVALEKFYKAKEYMFAKIAQIEAPSSENGNVLSYYVSEGTIRSIAIEGNSVTRKYVIEREIESQPGDIFSAAMLREDLRRIFNLNYFENVEPDIRYEEENGLVDLKVKVKEKKTSSVNAGGGYGEIQGWFGFVDLFLDNIAGTAQSVLVKASFGQKITSYQLRYHNPWMWSRKTSFTGRLWSTYGTNYIAGERELKNGWSAAIGFQRTLYVRETYSFKYEDVVNIDNSKNDFLDRALGYSIGYDSRDNYFNPTKGRDDTFSMWHSISFLGGTVDASRYTVQINRFNPLAPKQVFATRFMYNYAVGDIFATEQYYVGSETTVRGYKYGIFAKGTQRAVLNFEYRYIFTPVFTGLLFYDIGQAINPVYEKDDSFVNHHGWGAAQGFGLRLMTPLGPLRLDYGWPQYKEFGDGYLSFNIGYMF